MIKHHAFALFSFICAFLPSPVEAELKLLARPVSSGLLAFTWTRGGNADIYVLDFKTGEFLPIATSPVTDEYPAISRDGKRVAYYSDVDGDREIYVVNIDGTERKRLTSSPGADEDPHWAADGRLAFQSARGGAGSNIFIMNSDGTGVQQLTESRKRNSVPRWSADGRSILYSTDAHWPGWDIEAIDVASKRRRALTDGWFTNCRGDWSPSGLEVVFSSGRGSEIDVWTMNALGGNKKQLTSRPGKEYDAIWFPDGKGIFFAAELDPKSETYQLFSLTLPGGGATQVTAGDGSIRFLSFAAAER